MNCKELAIRGWWLRLLLSRGTDCSLQGSHLDGKNMKKGLSIPRNHGIEGKNRENLRNILLVSVLKYQDQV